MKTTKMAISKIIARTRKRTRTRRLKGGEDDRGNLAMRIRTIKMVARTAMKATRTRMTKMVTKAIMRTRIRMKTAMVMATKMATKVAAMITMMTKAAKTTMAMKTTTMES